MPPHACPLLVPQGRRKRPAGETASATPAASSGRPPPPGTPLSALVGRRVGVALAGEEGGAFQPGTGEQGPGGEDACGGHASCCRSCLRPAFQSRQPPAPLLHRLYARLLPCSATALQYLAHKKVLLVTFDDGERQEVEDGEGGGGPWQAGLAMGLSGPCCSC